MSCSDLSPTKIDEETIVAAEPFTVQGENAALLAASSGKNLLPDSLSRPFEGVFLKEKEKFTGRQQALFLKTHALLKRYGLRSSSPYYAFLSDRRNSSENFNWRFINLYPEQEVPVDTEEILFIYSKRVVNKTDPFNFRAARIPDTEAARQQVRKLGSRENQTVNQTSSQTAESVLKPPTEALHSQSSNCTTNYAQVCYTTGNPDTPLSCTIVIWEECTEPEEEGESGGGGGTPPPPPSGDCDPMIDICFDDPGGGGGSVDPPDTDPDPDMPCVGNPIKNPEIAPQTNSGFNGGRFGEDARKGWDEVNKQLFDVPHNGLDLKNSLGDNVYSMFDGEVYAAGFDERGWGNWIIIESELGGSPKFFLYAHLESFEVTGGSVQAGTVLEIAGDSGNMREAIDEGYAIQHLHIEVRDAAAGAGFTNAQKLNPESFVTTKFDESGQTVSGTEC